jgi:GNAT superfamily N-acetyltransferase
VYPPFKRTLASAASTEIDAASLDTETRWQISGDAADLSRPQAIRVPHTIRELGAQDEIAIRDLLLGLDEVSRVSRFSGVISDDAIARHVRQALREADWLAGLFVGNELCGVVELYHAWEPNDLEAAFTVACGWRRRGFGTALLFAAVQWARQARRTRLHLIFLRSNWPMRRLASKAEPMLDLTLDELVASVIIGDGWTNVAAPAAKPSRNDLKLFQASKEITHAKAF